MRETSLYEPVKAFLECLGFAAKGEIGGCDIVAVNGDEPPILVICELKLRFNLELVLQGVERAAACDEVWLAARLSAGRKGRESDTRFRALCRRLGFGMLVVADNGEVSVIVSPVAPFPRNNRKKRSRLHLEYTRRQGDTARCGSTRKPIMTAYRQEAIACANAMLDGPLRPRDLKQLSARAQNILRHNFYGWFERVDRGLYALTPAGREAIANMEKPYLAAESTGEPMAEA